MGTLLRALVVEVFARKRRGLIRPAELAREEREER